MTPEQEKIKADVQEQQRIKRLIHFRTQRIHKSQNQAAVLLGVKQATLSYVESGQRQASLALLEKFFTKFNMNSEWYMHGTGPEILNEPKKRNTIDSITELRAEIASLEKKIRVFEINQNRMLSIIEKLEDRIAKGGL
ncbi:hypothetical protein DBR40_21925 [Pedobacter sp. KBW01]|uniref:helix-turn-helix domain-containing protein n=1 Tax=Pedobacter sp. KBW01 TaxID=2153364 RepID=UPI000F59A2AC|nr:helix-turn-helix transcriptional regulator [Pedobacter sp. KBW01]RQO66812.1 hypothetical protein DBR40_21925 [Pedobacter sp. KBW01]